MRDCSDLKFQKYLKALHCPVRWKILKIIGKDRKSSREIYKELLNSDESMGLGTLYYHLSELKNAGIIEVAEYRETGAGAPEKLWKLKRKKIIINLIENDK